MELELNPPIVTFSYAWILNSCITASALNSIQNSYDDFKIQKLKIKI